MKHRFINIGSRKIGPGFKPFVIVEIGINHNGEISKAKQMIKDAYKAGAECVKFQAHVVEDEMTSAAKKIVPGHAKESIWDIMKKAAFSEAQDRLLKKYVESLGMIYLSTPFSRAGAERLNNMGVQAYKIGSGECNNYPLIEHIASFGKPVILSTGMNNIESIRKSVNILDRKKIPYALMQCTSMYPTPYDKISLLAIEELKNKFTTMVVGLSDHSVGNYASFAAIARGASLVENHFTSSKEWPGPDIALSLDPIELKDLIFGANAIHQALGGKKEMLPEEKDITNFAFACVVSIKEIRAGDRFTVENIWVKRPGTGQIKAAEFKKILGKKASRNIQSDVQLKYKDIL